VKRAYVKAGVIHADLSEYNIILKPDMHVLIIDWPQYVTAGHPNAEELLMRDVKNVLKYFSRRYGLRAKNRDVYAFVTGKGRVLAF
jgi:RIO kinase 2